MEQYLEYLQYNLKYITELETQVAVKPEIPEQKRPDILRMFGHRGAATESEIQWALKEIEYIATL
ncbi:hypothetical protein D3C73_1648250 [compost metagenome]